MIKKSRSYLASGIVALGLVMTGCSTPVAKFEVQKPGKISVSRKIKKIFINPSMINSKNDNLNIKGLVITNLKQRLNALGRFQVMVGVPKGIDPNHETIAVIQGSVISGGEVDNGQLSEKADCKGGLSGLAGAATAAGTSKQGITLSKRGMACKKANLKAAVAEGAVSGALSLLGVQEVPPVDEVVRVYKYKNVSLFSQVNLSITQIGETREQITQRSDAASFSRHIVNAKNYRNVRESVDGGVQIWAWLRLAGSPVAPVQNRNIAIVKATNPGSWQAHWYNYLTPNVRDIPAKERSQILEKLVNKSLTPFIRTISPYKAIIEASVAEGGNPEAVELLNSKKFTEARNLLEKLSEKTPADLYNLGLSFEAGAVSVEDYEDAMRYYSEALEKSPGTEIYAQGIGRMEFQLKNAKTLAKQTAK